MNDSFRLAALSCVVAIGACAVDTGGGATGNTEINLDIVNPGGTSGELGFSVDRVDYRVTCAGGSYLLPPYAAGPAGENGNPCSLEDANNDGIPDVCPPGSNYIEGTPGPDNITAGNGVNCIFGMGGNDVIQGGNSRDHICGGSGDDQLMGGNGRDLLIGGEGDDDLMGQNGDDYLDGGLGVDTLDGASGSDTCVEEVAGTSIRLTSCESSFSDAVDISGAFEVIDTRDPPVWQAVMDLPPGDCTITLSVWDGDEVVCIGSQTLAIAEDATTKYDIVLVCSLSIDLPDGMADVDGTFTFITGNLCPKLYVLNALPSDVGFDARTEIQYRAKDPDNSCGNNCDPQSCTFDNPPVCTPYPSNFNDPNCNPAFGGDPNSAGCQAGDFAGLVCTIIALEGSGGTPAGTFISPADETTPVGPVLPVNLNLASGIPGLILPGLGGPASDTTDNPSEPSGGTAGDNPLYPGLPNANGSLPPLVYQCDASFVGPTVINLTCSDGDVECDQNKQLVITCPGIDYCFGIPPDTCLGDNECLTDGFCNQPCNPLCATDQPTYDPVACCGVVGGPCFEDCIQCPGQNDPLSAGTSCTVGGNVCDGAGNCVECLADADCLAVLPPDACQEAPTCVANSCVAGGPVPAGNCSVTTATACVQDSDCPGGETCENITTCSNGVCNGTGTDINACEFVVVPQSCDQIITVGCGNNVTADVSILPFNLQASTPGVLGGSAVSVDLGGVAQFSETFLDAAQGAVVGGVTKAGLVDLNVDVQVRSGTAGAPAVIASMTGGAGIPYECWLSDTGPGAQEPCDPANDQASIPGARGNTDCAVVGAFNPCVPIVEVPISTDCTPTGACALAGKTGQCANGFCVTGGLPLPLDPQLGVAMGTADASGEILLGWFDTPADVSAAVGTPPIDGDGTYNMLQVSYTGVAGPIGLAVFAGLTVQLECVMAEDSGGPDGVGVPDDASPTPDASLCSFAIQEP